MKKFNALLGITAALTSFSLRAESISVENAQTLIKPFEQKIVVMRSKPGFQMTALGSAQIFLPSEEEKVCDYTYGIRSTHLEAPEEGVAKRLQEHYLFSKNQFDKTCTNIVPQKVVQQVFIEKDTSPFSNFDKANY